MNACIETLMEPPAEARLEDERVMSGKTPLRLWLVDDKKEIRGMLADVVSSEGTIECARQFASAEELLEALGAETAPEAILLDIHLGDGMTGLDALPSIRLLAPGTHVFIMTTFYDRELAGRAFSSGASGFILKRDESERTISTILKVTAEFAPGQVRPPVEDWDLQPERVESRVEVEATSASRRAPVRSLEVSGFEKPQGLFARAFGMFRAMVKRDGVEEPAA